MIIAVEISRCSRCCVVTDNVAGVPRKTATLQRREDIDALIAAVNAAHVITCQQIHDAILIEVTELEVLMTQDRFVGVTTGQRAVRGFQAIDITIVRRGVYTFLMEYRREATGSLRLEHPFFRTGIAVQRAHRMVRR